MTDQDFAWVTARHACSPYEVYKQLQTGCEVDVAERNALRVTFEYGFKMSPSPPGGNSFRVLRLGQNYSSSVEFKWNEAGISVLADDSAVLLAATLTLNDDGECRLKVNGEELTQWQFRKRALEDLLFGDAK